MEQIKIKSKNPKISHLSYPTFTPSNMRIISLANTTWSQNKTSFCNKLGQKSQKRKPLKIIKFYSTAPVLIPWIFYRWSPVLICPILVAFKHMMMNLSRQNSENNSKKVFYLLPSMKFKKIVLWKLTKSFGIAYLAASKDNLKFFHKRMKSLLKNMKNSKLHLLLNQLN